MSITFAMFGRRNFCCYVSLIYLVDLPNLHARLILVGERVDTVVMCVRVFVCVCVCACDEISSVCCGRTLGRRAFVGLLGSLER